MKIVQERKKCIGCGGCVAICPLYFKMDKDGKASLIKGKNNELEIKQETKELKDAADSCPVMCIKIVK